MTRDEVRCTATNRSGNQCGRAALPGARVCHSHGAGAPQVQAKAKERLLVANIGRELERMGWQSVTDPLAAFADHVGEVLAFRDLCREQLNTLTQWDSYNDATGEQLRPLVAVYERALDRSGKALTDMLRLGVDYAALEAAQARPSQEQAAALGRVLDRTLNALNLSDEDRARLPDALAAAMRAEGLIP